MTYVLMPAADLRAMSQAERDRLRRALDAIDAGRDPGSDVLGDESAGRPRETRPRVAQGLVRRDRR
jgi:hypothetical protein